MNSSRVFQSRCRQSSETWCLHTCLPKWWYYPRGQRAKVYWLVYTTWFVCNTQQIKTDLIVLKTYAGVYVTLSKRIRDHLRLDCRGTETANSLFCAHLYVAINSENESMGCYGIYVLFNQYIQFSEYFCFWTLSFCKACIYFFFSFKRQHSLFPG